MKDKVQEGVWQREEQAVVQEPKVGGGVKAACKTQQRVSKARFPPDNNLLPPEQLCKVPQIH